MSFTRSYKRNTRNCQRGTYACPTSMPNPNILLPVSAMIENAELIQAVHKTIDQFRTPR